MMRRLMSVFAIAALVASWLAATVAAEQSQNPAPGQTGGASAGAPPATAGPATQGSVSGPAGPPPEPVHEAIGAEMARYYMVFLRRSGKPALPAAEGRKIMEGHMDNIRRLAAEHKLLLAGPFMDQSGPGSLAGIFVLAAASAEEARQLV